MLASIVRKLNKVNSVFFCRILMRDENQREKMPCRFFAFHPAWYYYTLLDRKLVDHIIFTSDRRNYISVKYHIRNILHVYTEYFLTQPGIIFYRDEPFLLVFLTHIFPHVLLYSTRYDAVFYLQFHFHMFSHVLPHSKIAMMY